MFVEVLLILLIMLVIDCLSIESNGRARPLGAPFNGSITSKSMSMSMSRKRERHTT